MLNVTVWDRIFGALVFLFLVPVGMVILAMSIVEGEGDMLICGGTWIKACVRNIRDLVHR